MLNIKDPEAHALARKLAEMRGTSMTRAVVDALRRDLERIESETDTDAKERAQRIMAAAEAFRRAVGSAFPSREEIEADMYDEHGLPR